MNIQLAEYQSKSVMFFIAKIESDFQLQCLKLTYPNVHSTQLENNQYLIEVNRNDEQLLNAFMQNVKG